MRPGEAHVLVLAEHRDRRAAQRNLEALVGLGQFLGARLDALLELEPRSFQFLEGAQMGGDLGLQPVARGQPPQLRRELPDDDGGGQREQRRGRPSTAPRVPRSAPKVPTSAARWARPTAKMNRANSVTRAVSPGAAFPPPLVDVEQRDRDGQQRQGNYAVGDGMKQDKPGGPHLGLRAELPARQMIAKMSYRSRSMASAAGRAVRSGNPR